MEYGDNEIQLTAIVPRHLQWLRIVIPENAIFRDFVAAGQFQYSILFLPPYPVTLKTILQKTIFYIIKSCLREKIEIFLSCAAPAPELLAADSKIVQHTPNHDFHTVHKAANEGILLKQGC